MKRIWHRFRPVKQTTVETTSGAEALLQSLLEQTPAAVQAQKEMDTHPNGFHNNKIRLYELIDFNDTFVSLALSLSPAERRGFIERLRLSMQNYCRANGSPMFTDKQYDAITRGLSREVAVYLCALDQDYGAQMTSRTQDAMGVDMVITDPKTHTSLNIDCKTPSAYYYRVKDLVQQGRLSEAEAEAADKLGYVHEVNGQGDEAVAVTILRVDANELGEIKDFMFAEPQKLGQRFAEIFQNQAQVYSL